MNFKQIFDRSSKTGIFYYYMKVYIWSSLQSIFLYRIFLKWLALENLGWVLCPYLCTSVYFLCCANFYHFHLKWTWSTLLSKEGREIQDTAFCDSLGCTGGRGVVMMWPIKLKFLIILIVHFIKKNVCQFKNVLSSVATNTRHKTVSPPFIH